MNIHELNTAQAHAAGIPWSTPLWESRHFKSYDEYAERNRQFAEAEQKSLETYQQAAAARIKRILCLSGFPAESYLSSTDHLDLTGPYVGITKRLSGWVTDPDSTPFLLLSSKAKGVGKTLLGSVTAINFMLQPHQRVLFETGTKYAMVVNTTHLLAQLKRGMFSDASKWAEGDILESAMKADILVLDDLGAEKPTQFSVERLYTILDYRLSHLLPTIITSNCTLLELKHQFSTANIDLGDRLADRLSSGYVDNIKFPEITSFRATTVPKVNIKEEIAIKRDVMKEGFFPRLKAKLCID